MDAFFERLMTGAATIDELLSDDFETMPGGAGDSARAARRLEAWCRSSAAGDRSLFARRLQRDALAPDQVLARFTSARRGASAHPPAWVDDAIWIDESGLSTSDVRQWMKLPAGEYLINGSGGIGWGLAAAVGAAIARPDREVIAIIGWLGAVCK